MIEQIRDLGPIVLIPAAWIAAALSIVGYLGSQGMFIAHVVMAVFITFFAATGWTAMETGALRAWRSVLVVGLPVTLAGLAGFLVAEFETVLFAVSLVGWMVLPAAGFAYTARELPEAAFIYAAGGILSVVGGAVALGGIFLDEETFILAGIAFVAVGQTAGIVDASVRDSAGVSRR